jgi:hypothetical protein
MRERSLFVHPDILLFVRFTKIKAWLIHRHIKVLKYEYLKTVNQFEVSANMIKIRRFRTNRILTAIAASGTVFIFYGFQLFTSWSTLKSSGVRGSGDYIDQTSVLNSATCFKKFGSDIYKTDLEQANCGGFIYSLELLRVLNFFDLTTKDSFFLGTVFMWLTISTMCLVFFIIRNYGKTHYAIALIACLSPGVWLLLERGNYDEFVFCLVVAAGILLGSKRQFLGVVILGLTVLIKFYTLPAFLFSILMLNSKKTRRLLLLLAVPLFLHTLNLILLVPAFPSTWNVSFGLKSFGLYLEFAAQRLIDLSFTIPPVLTLIPGLVLLIFFTLLMMRHGIQPSMRVEESAKTLKIRRLYNLILVVFLSCYFAGMNFDYRLIYLSFLVSISSVIFHGNRYSALSLISGLSALTFNTFLFGLHGLPALAIQLVGDLSLSLYIATQLVYLLKTALIIRRKKRYISSGDFLKELIRKI